MFCPESLFNFIYIRIYIKIHWATYLVRCKIKQNFLDVRVRYAVAYKNNAMFVSEITKPTVETSAVFL
jgi:hypothetical protein